MINDNMSLNDIHEVTINICNSLYRLRKNGELNHMTDDEFKEMHKLASNLDNAIAWAILFENTYRRNK